MTFSARVHGTDDLGDDNLKTAWITYSYGATGCSCWQSVELTRSSGHRLHLDRDPGRRRRRPATLRFIVQAANGAALVGIDDNKGAYHSLASAAAGTPAPTTLDLTRRHRARTTPLSACPPS